MPPARDIGSSSGRLAAIGLGLALCAAGLAVGLAPEEPVAGLACGVLTIGAISFLIAVGLARFERAAAALAGILALPPVAGLSLAAVHAIAGESYQAGLALTTAGILAMAFGFLNPDIRILMAGRGPVAYPR